MEVQPSVSSRMTRCLYRLSCCIRRALSRSTRVVNIIRDFAIREFGYNRDSSTVADDPFGLRLGRWLTGIEPTVTGWETNSGFRIGIADNGYKFKHLSELVVSGQVSTLVTSLGAVFLLTTLMFRSWVAGLIKIIPISLVMIFSFGLLGLLGIPLELGKSLAAGMVIGIGIDYTIHFLSKYRFKVQEGLTDPAQITAATLATSGKAIFFMAACLVVSMTVLPAILNRFRPRFVYGEGKAAGMSTAPQQEAAV